MPPFVGAPPRMLQVNTHHQPARDEEEDSPIDSMADKRLDDDEAADSFPTVPKPKAMHLARPPASARSTTHPSSSILEHGYFSSSPQQPPQQRTSNTPRNRSPYSRSHLRSHSSGASLLCAPLMTRAHSMPNPHISRTPDLTLAAPSSSGAGFPAPPHSPMRSPRRVHSPFRQQLEENYMAAPPPPRSPGFASVSSIERIEEDSELDITRPRDHSGIMTTQLPAMASFSRSASLRRRPASPLYSLAQQHQQQALPSTSTANMMDAANSLINQTSALSSASSSPSLGPQRYPQERFMNESYPTLSHYASTSSFSSSNFPSMPSTPTSMRSRSPSISSLDTIEDEPDMESAALEFERLQQLNLAAEKQERMERGEIDDAGDEGDGVGVRRRSSLDVPRIGFGRNGRDAGRKRWSICGGERRGDLDLETIWED
ncbi:hypothetical protein LTR08_001347 [Meristemomyces frigidus]|nr:hypothetical protein LTR08_001347 [Meristemomyces frigidus]